ncbi:GH92 family glycosyl hydrolase [Enterovibrio norvegicus]|uniref:GH92 family glycosyl hydrolase n=1 Tax=Enterovibrio norvegicus TaxID=188144 RepID=UPI000C82C9AE|nr:GH92 family glycosyl hydrolase [Enterovibrio norvegicus]PML75603.1 alpha-mannosidase [Enterovibrio norvegicus]
MINKKSVLSMAIVFALAGCNSSSSDNSGHIGTLPQPDLSVLNYVDTLIGTKGLGNVNPSPVMPEGMIQPSPDNFDPNGWNGKGSPSEYDPTNALLSGFTMTHISGAGKGDLNDFAFLPYTGFNTDAPTINKDTETAEVGYYSVELKETGVKAELTATDRVAFQRYTFKKGEDRKVRIDLQHELLETYGNHSRNIYYKRLNDTTVVGARTSNEWGQWQTVFFVAEFSESIVEENLYAKLATESTLRPVDATEVGLADYRGYAEHKPMPGEPEPEDERLAKRANDVMTHLNFGKGDAPITVKVAISGTSVDGAINNLNADTNDFNFDAVVEKNRIAWAEILGEFELEGGKEADKTMFYTSLYRTYVAPFVYQDVDGKYRGMDGKVHQAEDGLVNYSVYSMWDTFRAAHPLKTIIDKSRAVEYAHDLLNKYKTGGVLPKWELHSDYTGEMVGHPAVSVIADIMVKHPEAFTQDHFELAIQAANDTLNFSLGKTDSWVPYKDAWSGDKRFTIMTRHNNYQEELGYIPANAKWTVDAGDKPAYVNGISEDKYDGLVNESVSYGLENAYYDWTVAQIAKLAGDDVSFERYMARSEAFKNYFDYNPEFYGKLKDSKGNSLGATGFMRPVYNQNGEKVFANNLKADCVDENLALSIPQGLDYNACKDRKSLTENDVFWPYRAEHRGEDFTEGNTWQWTWFAPHSINGLGNVMAGQNTVRAEFDTPEALTAEGKEALLANLNALFNANSNADTSQSHDMSGYIGQFVMGNEPDHHVPMIYNWTAEPWKTQEIVDRAMNEFYHPTLEGLIGNEDVGQMSAWYVMNALGFYQVTPADPSYTITRPIFDKAVIPVDGGAFTITTENNSEENIYVKSVAINGKPLNNNFSFKHSDLKAGGQLSFVMTGNKEDALK